MGNPIARIGDNNSGHDCWGPVPLIEGSENVFANGIAVSRIGDSFAEHCCWGECHSDVMTTGSSSVRINGKPVARIGESAGEAVVVKGSHNVSAG